MSLFKDIYSLAIYKAHKYNYTHEEVKYHELRLDDHRQLLYQP